MNSLHPETPNGFNWHPAVHASHFGETLYFVMIRLREPLHRPVADQIHDLLTDAGIQYACEYSLFGYWDALIRVWLGPSSYRRLVRTLREKARHNIADVRAFTVEQLYYLRLGKNEDLLVADQALLATITAHSAAIDRVSDKPDLTDTPDYNKLSEEDLVFPLQEAPENAVKFYTALTRTSDDSSPDQELSAISLAMSETAIPTSKERMIDRATLYRGSGELGHYLIRCVADKYSDVLDLIESFDIYLKGTGLRPMTLLVASSHPRESDNANDRLHLTLDDTKAAEVLGFHDPAIFAKLSDDHRRELRHLIATACEVSNSDNALREKLVRILRASLENKSAVLEQELIFLHRFEPRFNSAIKGDLEYAFGTDWATKVRDLCLQDEHWRKHGEMMQRLEEDNGKWTIGTYLTTALAASAFDAGFRGALERRFQSDSWEKETRALLELRNTFAHGEVSLWERLDFYNRKTVKFLVSVINAAALYHRSEQILETTH